MCFYTQAASPGDFHTAQVVAVVDVDVLDAALQLLKLITVVVAWYCVASQDTSPFPVYF